MRRMVLPGTDYRSEDTTTQHITTTLVPVQGKTYVVKNSGTGNNLLTVKYGAESLALGDGGFCKILYDGVNWLNFTQSVDALTFGGLTLNDFTQYGQRTGDQLNNHKTLATGIYNIEGGDEASKIGLDSATWHHIIHMKHTHENGYATQITACAYADPSMKIRASDSEGWKDWVEFVTDEQMKSYVDTLVEKHTSDFENPHHTDYDHIHDTLEHGKIYNTRLTGTSTKNKWYHFAKISRPTAGLYQHCSFELALHGRRYIDQKAFISFEGGDTLIHNIQAYTTKTAGHSTIAIQLGYMLSADHKEVLLYAKGTYSDWDTHYFQIVSGYSGSWAFDPVTQREATVADVITEFTQGDLTPYSQRKVSIDTSLSDNSDDNIPTEKAVKTYTDNKFRAKTDQVDADTLGGLEPHQLMRNDINSTVQALSRSYSTDIQGTHIIQPKDAMWNQNESNAVGYLKITLPVSWSNTMMSMYVDLYDYAGGGNGEAISMHLCGYNYITGSTWRNVSATVLTGRTDKFFDVHFGHDDSKCSIYIGEANSAWNYPQVQVRNVFLGYSGQSVANWEEGWNVGFTTTLGSISATKKLANYASDSALFAGQELSSFPRIKSYNDEVSLDLNTLQTSGMYRLGPTLVNAPTSVNVLYGQLLVVSGGSDTITQIASSYNGTHVYIRSGNPVNNSSGSWNPWTEVFHSGKSMLYNASFKGIYFDGRYEDDLAHDGAWGYIRRGPLPGQLEIGSDNLIDIYETDQRTLALQISTNNKTLDAKGGLLEGGVALKDKYLPKITPDIPANTDLNTYTTTGSYHQNMSNSAGSTHADAGLNYPCADAGMLNVWDDGHMTYQEYRQFNNGHIWVRGIYRYGDNTEWRPWERILIESDKNSLSGDFTLTGNMKCTVGAKTNHWARFKEHEHGNVMYLGSGGMAVVGGGEAADVVYDNVAVGNEDLYLVADGNIRFITYSGSGGNNTEKWANRKDVGIMDTDGRLTLYEDFEAKKNITATGEVTASKVMNSVWNDIADFIEVEKETPIEYGKVYTRREDGTHHIANKYASTGLVGIASDTFGFGVGEKKKGTPQVPIGIGGFVLAHIDKVYPVGTPLTSSKRGGVTKANLLTRLCHPERIIASFYKAETKTVWNKKIQVNNRHWVKIQ